MFDCLIYLTMILNRRSMQGSKHRMMKVVLDASVKVKVKRDKTGRGVDVAERTTNQRRSISCTCNMRKHPSLSLATSSNSPYKILLLKLISLHPAAPHAYIVRTPQPIPLLSNTIHLHDRPRRNLDKYQNYSFSLTTS